jgi:hypothetical protein
VQWETTLLTLLLPSADLQLLLCFSDPLCLPLHLPVELHCS